MSCSDLLADMPQAKVEQNWAQSSNVDFHQNTRGFSLIETLVALGILGVVIAAASTSLIKNLYYNHRAEILFEGVHAAQTVLDDLRFEDISNLPSTGTDSPRTVTSQSKRQYKVYVTYCKTSQYCSSESVRQLHVRVEFKSRTVYETETVFTEFGSSADDDNASSSSSSSISSASSSSAVSSSSSSSSSSSRSSSSSSSRSSSSSSSRSRCRTYRC